MLVVPGLRSSVEDRWRTAAKAAGKGADLEAIRAIDPDLVERETMLLGSALRGVFEAMPDGGRALVVGHSPTNEAAVLGLAAEVIGPLGKGEGVLLSEDGGRIPRPVSDAREIDPRPTGQPVRTTRQGLTMRSAVSGSSSMCQMRPARRAPGGKPAGGARLPTRFTEIGSIRSPGSCGMVPRSDNACQRLSVAPPRPSSSPVRRPVRSAKTPGASPRARRAGSTQRRPWRASFPRHSRGGGTSSRSPWRW